MTPAAHGRNGPAAALADWVGRRASRGGPPLRVGGVGAAWWAGAGHRYHPLAVERLELTNLRGRVAELVVVAWGPHGGEPNDHWHHGIAPGGVLLWDSTTGQVLFDGRTEESDAQLARLEWRPEWGTWRLELVLVSATPLGWEAGEW